MEIVLSVHGDANEIASLATTQQGRRSPRMLTVSPGKSRPGDAEAMAEGIKAYLQAQADSQSLKPCPSADKANQSAERQT